ncbi:MAG TPA: hypothetical protein PKC18_15215 [Lacipirellulaceae bacterium]|nr:hypothetical protein [Lacipirellulaceae bacterium]
MSPRSAIRRSRTGVVYVAVLGVAMIIALLGLAAVHISRVETRAMAGAEQIAHAQLLSASAVELALARIAIDANWRSTYSSGVEVPSATWTTLGNGSVRFALVDPDGSLSDDPRDGITIRGIGRFADAIQVVAVDALPAGTPLTSLAVALHSDGNLTNSAAMTCDHIVSSNGSINTPTGSIAGTGWAVGSIVGNVTTKYANQAPARQMPDADAVWQHYLSTGTRISIGAIAGNRIEYVVMSPGNNPFGATNPQGIYVVDCQGQNLTISNCRMHATLVVINAGSVVLRNRINWHPPTPNYPALMVQGTLEMAWDGNQSLTETTLVPLALVNYNPPGSPYEGMEDSDVLDSYPGVINGLVYVSGNLTITQPLKLFGAIIAGGTTSVSASATLNYNSVHAAAPPPGFATGSALRLIPGTWRRLAR